MIERERLASANVFKPLNPEQQEQIANICEEVTFRDGDKIFGEGETAEVYYLLEKGGVDLRFEYPFRETCRKMTVVSIRPVECFSWSALIPPHKATLSAYSVGLSKAIRIPGHKLMSLFEKDPSMGFLVMRHIAAVVARRLSKQQELFIKETGQNLHFQW